MNLFKRILFIGLLFNLCIYSSGFALPPPGYVENKKEEAQLVVVGVITANEKTEIIGNDGQRGYLICEIQKVIKSIAPPPNIGEKIKIKYSIPPASVVGVWSDTLPRSILRLTSNDLVKFYLNNDDSDENSFLPAASIGSVELPKDFTKYKQRDTVEKKSALIIGNFDYKEIPSLRFVEQNVQDLRRVLKEIGFIVTLIKNATHKNIRRSLREFTYKANEDEIVLIFYSGHWACYNGENYLVPIDARLRIAGDLRYKAIPLKEIFHFLEENKGNIITLFDFSSNIVNSYFKHAKLYPTWNRPQRIRSDVLISFSSQPKTMPCDLSERNNTYVTELIRLLREHGISVEELFRRLSHYVRRETNGCQIPWFESTLTKKVYLNLNYIRPLLDKGLIYEGFYWYKPVPPDKTPTIILQEDQLQDIGAILSNFLANLSSHGWNPGIPNRTILLEPEGIRLVYGGSMGDEFGVTGKIQGFFRSDILIKYLKKLVPDPEE